MLFVELGVLNVEMNILGRSTLLTSFVLMVFLFIYSILNQYLRQKKNEFIGSEPQKSNHDTKSHISFLNRPERKKEKKKKE